MHSVKGFVIVLWKPAIWTGTTMNNNVDSRYSNSTQFPQNVQRTTDRASHPRPRTIRMFCPCRVACRAVSRWPPSRIGHGRLAWPSAMLWCVVLLSGALLRMRAQCLQFVTLLRHVHTSVRVRMRARACPTMTATLIKFHVRL